MAENSPMLGIPKRDLCFMWRFRLIIIINIWYVTNVYAHESWCGERGMSLIENYLCRCNAEEINWCQKRAKKSFSIGKKVSLGQDSFASRLYQTLNVIQLRTKPIIHWTLYNNSDEALYYSHRTADPMLLEIFNIKKISMKALYDNHWRMTAASFRGSASTIDQAIRCYESFPKVNIEENYP